MFLVFRYVFEYVNYLCYIHIAEHSYCSNESLARVATGPIVLEQQHVIHIIYIIVLGDIVP